MDGIGSIRLQASSAGHYLLQKHEQAKRKRSFLALSFPRYLAMVLLSFICKYIIQKTEAQLEVVLKYFTDFTPEQLQQLQQLEAVYKEWNEKINVTSRKDIDSLYEKHVLHSLAIAAVFNFQPGTQICDLGTGGGFPGIPLAIFFLKFSFI